VLRGAVSEVQFRLLDLNLLRVFDALIEERSVTRAAQRLHITPSAVSHALARLRDLFQDQLFIRGPQGMQATPRAAEIGPRLREGLHQIEMALTPLAFNPEASTRVFTIACSGYICAVLLPELMRRMRMQAPGAKLVVRSLENGVVGALEGGQVDVLVGGFGHIPDRFSSELLFHDAPVWLLGRDYLHPKTEISADRVAQLPRLNAMAGGNAELVEGLVVENGLERRVSLDEHSGVIGVPLGDRDGGPVLASIPYSSVAPLIVKHNDMAALLPRRLANLFVQSFDLDIAEPESDLRQLEILSLWHREHGNHAAVVWFRSLLTEIAADL
jgi:DNA-binding transcriptional LysR family regulator